MNQFLLHAKVLHMERPKADGRSGLMLCRIGSAAQKRVAPHLSFTDKVIIRYPFHLAEKVASLLEESLACGPKVVEVSGNLGGIAKRGVPGTVPYLYAELIAQRISDLEIAPALRGDEGKKVPDEVLHNRFSATGLVEVIRRIDDNRPPTLYLRVGPRRTDEGRLIEHSNILVFSLTGQAAKRYATIEVGDALVVDGFIGGVMRTVKVDDYEHQSLEPRLLVTNVNHISYVPASIFRATAQRERRREDAVSPADGSGQAGNEEPSAQNDATTA